ncbi:hypothetical protein BC332_11516 [Capsicum chinense]|uniref:DUF2062 domain-containing protein n=1 Tax=Capsicum annuum TaxID=4072 RepID=A0A1U8GKB9_CAPAN|nr:uncharacterized protein LOC107867455 [Capsicum annuum]KAF3638068.1 putative glycerophosphoryl diester phosphodiesterase YhdW-like [Capsicum annuum]PHT84265.1 hypothetical protein T459_12708 [Capsicum annuum]PHU20365.1 hypothetical protein BC332_11516 [Capsicum chinense]
MLRRIGLIVGPWTHKKVVDPLLQILRRGLEPKQLAFSVALGVTLGLFPIVGVAVFLCGFAIAALGSMCHAPTVLLANFIVTPIELSLVIPFLRLGESVSGGPHFALTSDALTKVLTGKASWEVILSIYHALLGWLVATPFILAGLYVLLLPCFTILVRKFSSGGGVPSSPRRVVPSSPKRAVPTSPKMIVQPLTEVRVKVRDV